MSDQKSITLYQAPGSCTIVGCDPWETEQLLIWAAQGAAGEPPVKVKVVDQRG